MAKKVVVKLQINDGKDKQKAMKSVSTLFGIESLAVDLKEKKLTVVGYIDPVEVVSKLRKCGQAEIVTVGPAKEPEKEKKEEKKDEKEDEKKKEEEEKKKKEEEEKKKKEEEMKKLKEEQIAELRKQYRGYYPPYNMPPCYNPPYYYVCSSEENPNSCTIL